MNYYEELGLRPGASSEEIHQAYRNLIRILHPDQFRDERLKRLAECQVKRLNEVLSVLDDAVLRSEYDRRLRAAAAGPRPGTRTGLPARRGRRWLLLAAAAALLLAGALLFYTPRSGDGPGEGTAASARRAEAGPAGPAALPSAAAPERASHGRKGPQQEEAALPRGNEGRSKAPPLRLRPRSFPEPAPSASERAVELLAMPPPLAVPAVTALPAYPSPAVPVASDPPPKPAAPPFAGEWVFVPGRRSPPAGTYPPEFIEMNVAVRPGGLAGRYRARYRVKDQPVSGEVSFSFEGTLSGESAEVEWTGNGGAAGSARLTLVSPDSVRVDWWTTRNGQRPSLASGSGLLVRR